MIQLTATGRDARATPSEPITAGSVGLPVVLDLNSDFDGLAVTVCFEAGEAKADVAYLGDPVTVPAQCLTVVGAVLRIGVYGALPNGTIVIPTVWATVGLVRKGSIPSGVDPSQPEPDWTAQVLAAARDAKETAERIEGEVDEWAEAEAARVRAEDARDSAEAARRSAEQARAGAESIRADAETNRVAAEGIRITNENARTSNELARATAEQGRATAETGRALAETARAEAEQVRATAETARNGAEAARAQAEQQRDDAERQRAASETARTTAEQARATAEQGRAAAETARAEAETLRATAEQGRADAEASRAQAWAELEADVTAATDAATEAAAALRPEITWLRGNQLTKELSGELMQASDAYAAPMLSLGVDGKSTQDGTPTPDAPVEIVSVENPVLHFAGKNLLDPSNVITGTYINSYGERASGSSNTSTGFIEIVGGDTYTISYASNNGTGNYLAWYTDANQSNVTGSRVDLRNAASRTVVAPSDARYVRFSFTTSLLSTAQFQHGSTATAYESYQGQTVPLYDGTLRSLPDGTKDTLTLSYLRPSSREGWAWYTPEVTRLIDGLLFPEMSWTYRAVGVDSTGQAQSRFTARFNAFGIGAGIRPTNCFCSAYAVQASSGDRNTIFPDGSIYQLTGYASLYQNGVTDSRFDNVADFLAANANTEIVAKLIEPTTETLDPIELPILPAPNCTVWADPTTGLQMEYVQDTNIVIASLQAALADLATS